VDQTRLSEGWGYVGVGVRKAHAAAVCRRFLTDAARHSSLSSFQEYDWQ